MKGIIIIITLLSSHLILAQSDSSQLSEPTQFRRGTELQAGYQTYLQKYFSKNLNDEKRKLFPLQSTGVWTELNPKVPRVDYLGIHFVNVDTGWAVGDLGALIKTTDGGLNWTTEETNTTTPILKVNSFNGQKVIASGFNGLILRSTDGGESWTQITSGVTGDLWGLQMINDSLGWACGTGNALIKTTDAGIIWQTVITPGYTGNKWWLDFLNENYGFIAGDGKVLRTTDGGNSWDIIQAGDNQALYSIDVIDSLHIAAAGYGGTGYRGKTIYSSDGGDNWITGGQTTFDPINCIKYVSADTGYIVMSEVGLWKTTNSGQNWTLLDSIPLTNIGEFEIQLFKQQNVGYNVGSSLKIYKADGSLNSWHKIIINDDFTAVFFTSEQKGFVLSDGLYSKLFKTTDGGTSWDTVLGVPGGNCITFTDSLTGYYGTTASQIYKTTNGGENWYPTNGIITRIAKILFVSQQTGWAVGETRIYKTTDGGENWFEQVNRPGAGFTSISFVDSLYGWVSLGGWNPYKTTDGGVNWIEQTNFNNYSTSDVYFANHNTGWIVDDFDGLLFKTTNAGIIWDTVGGMYHPRKFTFFPDTSHWWTYGFSHIYETTNNGINWQEILPPSIVFSRFSAPLKWLGYGVGGGGFIVNYTDSVFIPVELITLGTDIADHKIIMTWSTSTETNNKGFDIERFDESLKTEWKKIGYEEGNGTTTKPNSYSFTDENVTAGTYKYRLKQIDFNGGYNYSKEIEVQVTSPTDFSLMQNYPNPFNPETNISFTIPEESNVSIRLYDITGREIKVLVNEKKQPGYYTIKLKGGELSSGVYFYRLTTSSGFTAVKKLILLK